MIRKVAAACVTTACQSRDIAWLEQCSDFMHNPSGRFFFLARVVLCMYCTITEKKSQTQSSTGVMKNMSDQNFKIGMVVLWKLGTINCSHWDSFMIDQFTNWNDPHFVWNWRFTFHIRVQSVQFWKNFRVYEYPEIKALLQLFWLHLWLVFVLSGFLTSVSSAYLFLNLLYLII